MVAVPVALLVDNADGLDANLKRISFTPTHYSPAFELVDKQLVKELGSRAYALPADLSSADGGGVDARVDGQDD